MPAGHFRLLFAHAARDMPDAAILADDDIDVAHVAAGESGGLDHPLMAPHQPQTLTLTLTLTLTQASRAASTTLSWRRTSRVSCSRSRSRCRA